MRFLNPTLSGLLALAIWSTSVAFTRTLTEKLGPATFLAVCFSAGGLLALFFEWLRHGRVRILYPRPAWPFLLVGGACFVGYCLGYAFSLAMAPDRQVTMQLGVVNYMWPGLTVFSLMLMLNYRARWGMLIPGLVCGCLGVAFSMAGKLSLGLFASAIVRHHAAFALMLGSAVCWAVYSGAARRFAPKDGANGAPLFSLAAGALCFAVRFAAGEHSEWSMSLVLPAAYYSILVVALAYGLWDTAMQRGRAVLLATLSYLLPLFSTLFAGWYLHEPVGPHLLAGAALMILGAVLCNSGVERR